MHINIFGKEVGTQVRLAVLIGIALLQSVILARHYPAPIIGDEVKYLLLAKYPHDAKELGYFGTAMPGWPMVLDTLGFFTGGFGNLSADAAFRVACALNVIFTVAIALGAFYVLRILEIDQKAALLGSIAIVTMPIFHVWSMTAMSEVLSAALIFAFCGLTVVIYRRSSHFAIFIALYVVDLVFVSTKAIGLVSLSVAATAILIMMRDSRAAKIMLSVMLAIATNALFVRHYTYGMRGLMSLLIQHIQTASFWELMILGCIVSVAYSAIVAALLMSYSTDRLEIALLVASAIGFLFTAIALSSTFHANIGLLSNYRTVVSAEPALLLILVSLALRAPADSAWVAEWRLFSLLTIFGGLLALSPAGPFQTNIFDWFTFLPLVDYISAQHIVSPRRGLVGLLILAVIAVAFVRGASPSRRVYGLIGINLALCVYFTVHAWSLDPWGRDDGYRANQTIARQVLRERGNIRLLMNEKNFDPDWNAFVYPYIWAARERTTLSSVATDFSGIIVTRDRTLDGHTAFAVAKSPTHTFYAYKQ